MLSSDLVVSAGVATGVSPANVRAVSVTAGSSAACGSVDAWAVC